MVSHWPFQLGYFGSSAAWAVTDVTISAKANAIAGDEPRCNMTSLPTLFGDSLSPWRRSVSGSEVREHRQPIRRRTSGWRIRARCRFFESASRSSLLTAHDLFRKPVSTFRDHALIDVLVPILVDHIRPLIGHRIADALGHRIPFGGKVVLLGRDLLQQGAQLVLRRPVARDHGGGVTRIIRDRIGHGIDLVDHGRQLHEQLLDLVKRIEVDLNFRRHRAVLRQSPHVSHAARDCEGPISIAERRRAAYWRLGTSRLTNSISSGGVP